MQVLKGVGFLEVCGKVKVVSVIKPESRNSTRKSNMLHVNVSVGCALLSFSRKLSNSSLVPSHM